MKKFLSLLLCVSMLAASLCLLPSCKKTEKVYLYSEEFSKFSKYITLNVEITNYRYENGKYLADIIIETGRASASVEFESVRLEKPELSDLVEKLRGDDALGNGIVLHLDYLGSSRTMFTYSSSTNFSNRYGSMITGCKTGWLASGTVLVTQ